MAAKSSTGLNKNTSAALSYVLGVITGVIFLVLEKDPFVRFHAMQSIVFFIAYIILVTVLGFTIILLPLVPLAGIVFFILWLTAIYKAWQGEKWEIPFLGKFAKDLAKKA